MLFSMGNFGLTTRRRPLRLERLEQRQLLASDLDAFAFAQPPANSTSIPPVPRIIGGTETTGFPSVGLIGDTGGSFCTGTLIAPVV